MIRIDEQITVPVPADATWKVLSDPHAVVGCIKGAELIRENADGTYDGRLTVHFGPLRVGFAARVTLELDETEMRGHITARGKDQHGATRMSTEATFVVLPGVGPAASIVHLDGAVTLTGTLASQMEAGASTVVRRMTTEFTDNLVARCAPDVVREIPPPRRRWLTAIRRWLRLGRPS